MSGLSDKAVLKGDENCSEESSGCAAFESAHCEVCERNGGNTQHGWQHSHCDIRYIFIDSVIA